MKKYFVLGGLRNIFGIALLTYLTGIGLSVTLALLIVVLIGFSLYVVQVRLSVGNVDVFRIAKVFAGVFVINRVLLWLFCSVLSFPIYFAQIVSVVLITLGSYLILKGFARKGREAIS